MREGLDGYSSYVKIATPWIGSYPSTWTLTRVKFESYVKARVGWHGLKSDDFTDEGPYLVTGTDFSVNRINWKDCHHCDFDRYAQDEYIQLREGDLLITKDGTIGKLAIVDGLDGLATLNSGIFVVRPLTPRYTSRFYFWLLMSSVFKGFVSYRQTGSTIVHLYQETFENFSFALPSINEQIQIASFLDYETAKIDALIEKQQQLISLLGEKRQAVISHAVTKGLNADAPMRDSGVEWLGEVPAHWEVTKLGRFANVTKLTGFEYTNHWKIEPDGEIVALRGYNIKQGHLDLSTVDRISSDLSNFLERSKLHKNDIVFPCTGTVGDAAIINQDDKFHINQNIAKITFDGTVSSEFALCFLFSDFAKQQFVLLNTSGVQPVILICNIRGLMMVIPPLQEQNEISAYVAEISEKLKSLLGNAERTVDLLQERRTALISAAVTGKIDVRNWKRPTNNKNLNSELEAA